MSSVMGRLPHTFGRERIGYSCGTLFVDHASGKLFNFCQYSTNANETISSKRRLESLACQEGITIKEYHADNGVFASNAFKDECDSLNQQYSYSGVGAHHQNGIAERNIKTVAQWARANMLHFAHHWPAQANVRFWPQAIEYAIWVFN
jgi:transposase InsO family protein